MRRSVLFIVTVILATGLIVSLALLTAPNVQAAGDAGAGKAVFDKKCKTCHGATGEGNPTIAKTMKVTLKHLGAKEVQQKKDDELKKEITEGVGKMKPVKDLQPGDLAGVIAFLRTLKEK